jgi:hypothetical protein
MALESLSDASICTDERRSITDDAAVIPLSYPRIGQDSRKCSEPDQAFASSALYLVER